MKAILNISVNDYANFGHNNAESLRAAGLYVTDVTLSSHTFEYANCSTLVTQKELDRLIRHHDIIQLFHSPIILAERLKATGKPVIVYHTGTSYRQQPEPIHRAFDGWVKMHVCALPELYEAFKLRSIEPCIYAVGGIDNLLPDNLITTKDFIVGHFPSNPDVKGTDKIERIFDSLLSEAIPLHFKLERNRVSYDEQLKRLSECDIYVEMLADRQGKNEYGSFGITALEAASMGKIVITNCTHRSPYELHYGALPFIIANNERELELTLVELAEFSTDELRELKKSYHQLFASLHSHEQSGKYLIENVLKGLL